MTTTAAETNQPTEDALSSFLLSIVVVDDHAALGEQPDATGQAHPLNAKLLVDAFADRGIVCGVIKPTVDDSDVVERVCKAARRADAVVLDWVLKDGDDGELASQIIEALLKDDDAPHKLRHFVIYTGQTGISPIAKRCKAILEKADLPYEPAMEGDVFTFWRGPITMSVFAKSVFEPPSEEIAARISEPSDLPGNIISDYLKRKPGMIESAALRAVAQIRLHTHRLLARIASDVDAGYMWHRVMLEDIDDAPAHVVEMIGAELTDLIDTVVVREEVSEDAAMRWIESRKDLLTRPGQFIADKATTPDELSKIIKLGAIEAKEQKVSLRAFKDKGGGATSGLPIFADDKASMENSHELFSMLMTLRKIYDSCPILQAGVVVEAAGEFMLCVQPLCDSVRFKESKTRFPFLKLVKPDEQKPKFNVVVPDPTRRVHLMIPDKPSDLVMIEFDTPNGPIEAEKDGERLVFRPTDKEQVFAYRATLRPMKSVSVITILAGRLSRTGINDPEWLRGNS